MAKVNEAKGIKETKSNAPILIIGGVLIVAVVAGWYLLSSRTPASPANSNRAANTANTPRTSSIPPNAPPGANPPNYSGSPTAAITLEEFADFQCGSCASVHPTLNEIKSLYGSRIKFVFRNFPLSIAAHDKAYEAAVATEAAGMQGKFWDMQNLLFANQQAWTASPTYKQIWKGYAEKIGLDVAKWESDLAGLPAKQRVEADMARGKALSVNSTPTLFLNGVSIPFNEMSVANLKPIIDQELQKASSATAPPANPQNSNALNQPK
jgi:protein-disulfide isomerase